MVYLINYWPKKCRMLLEGFWNASIDWKHQFMKVLFISFTWYSIVTIGFQGTLLRNRPEDSETDPMFKKNGPRKFKQHSFKGVESAMMQKWISSDASIIDNCKQIIQYFQLKVLNFSEFSTRTFFGTSKWIGFNFLGRILKMKHMNHPRATKTTTIHGNHNFSSWGTFTREFTSKRLAIELKTNGRIKKINGRS